MPQKSSRASRSFPETTAKWSAPCPGDFHACLAMTGYVPARRQRLSFARLPGSGFWADHREHANYASASAIAATSVLHTACAGSSSCTARAIKRRTRDATPLQPSRTDDEQSLRSPAILVVKPLIRLGDLDCAMASVVAWIKQSGPRRGADQSVRARRRGGAI